MAKYSPKAQEKVSKKFILSANYGLGIAKIQSGTESDDDNNNKHRVFSILIGLRF